MVCELEISKCGDEVSGGESAVGTANFLSHPKPRSVAGSGSRAAAFSIRGFFTAPSVRGSASILREGYDVAG